MFNVWPEWDKEQKKWIPEYVEYSTELEDVSSNENRKSGPVCPNWTKWKHMRCVQVYDAVSLALNLNPEVVRHLSIETEPEIVKKLREVSMSLVSLRKSQHGPHSVDLLEYGNYAEKNLSGLLIDGMLPAEFPQMASIKSEGKILDERGDKTMELSILDDNLNAPPYLTSKLKALFKIMRAVKENQGKKPVGIIEEMTGLQEREARILASIINEHCDGRAGKLWLCERGVEPDA